MMPLISVIIPVYNVEKYIRQCLESIINQSFKNIEIICIDDCSTDNSLNILKEYSKKDDRIKVIHNEKNINVGASRNKGLDLAKGKYIHFIDSDDWIEPNTYEYLMKFAGQVEVLYFYIQQISDIDNKKVKWSHYDGKEPKNICNIKTNPEITDNWVRFVYNKLYLKSFLDKNNIRFNDYPCFEDHEFSLKVLLSANSIYFVDKTFYNYRVNNPKSITAKFYMYKEYAYKSYKTAEKLFEPFEKDLKNKLLINEFGKYFQILKGMYNFNKMNYSEFKEELKRIDTSSYDPQILNKKMFVHYNEILAYPEFLYNIKCNLRTFIKNVIILIFKLFKTRTL